MITFHLKLLIIISFIFLISCSSYNSLDLNNTYKSSEIINEFKNNIEKSNKKYSRKTLTIVGRIDQYYKNKNNEITIIISDKGQTEGIKCDLTNSHKQIKKPLKQGKIIIIKGKYNGFNDFIILKKCYIIP